MPIAGLCVQMLLFKSSAIVEPITGLWEAVIHYDDSAVPLQIRLAGSGCVCHDECSPVLRSAFRPAALLHGR
jgi:hypothetical protein